MSNHGCDVYVDVPNGHEVSTMATTADYKHDMIMMTLLERQFNHKLTGVKYSVIGVVTANGVRYLLMLIRENTCTGVYMCYN